MHDIMQVLFSQEQDLYIRCMYVQTLSLGFVDLEGGRIVLCQYTVHLLTKRFAACILLQ